MNLRTILILGSLSAFGPLAIDFYLPGFPAMASYFGTDDKHIQLTLAAYFLGLSLGQLAYGPVADRFGRRIPLLFGVTMFMLASIACAFAPSLEWLIGARFVQALGGCAGIVLSRAIVSDKCNAVESAKVFSQLMLVMGLAPILAPMLGGVLVSTFGWQSIFVSLALFSGACLAAVALGLPESMPASTPRQPLSGAFRQYVNLLQDRVFIGHALTGGIAMAGMFAYVAGSPFVFIKLYGVPAEHYGWLLAVRDERGGFHSGRADQCASAAQDGAGIFVVTNGLDLSDRGAGVAGDQLAAHRSALAAAGAIVHLRGKPWVHHPQCVSLRHERPVGACGQCLGAAGLSAIQCCRHRRQPGGLVA